MKIITILGLVQTGLLVFLLGKILLVEEDPTAEGHDEQNTWVSDSFDVPRTDNDATDVYYLDAGQLRQIIREELLAHLDSQPAPVDQAVSATAASSTDTAEYQRRREQVVQQLDYYSSVGSISDADMQILQVDIAKLDRAGRREMLGKLTRAMNAGELEGRL